MRHAKLACVAHSYHSRRLQFRIGYSGLVAEFKKRYRPPVPAHLNFQAQARRLVGRSLNEVFAEIHRTNLWEGEDSVSGQGSSFAQTAELIIGIPALLRQLGTRSLLDVPCGDFSWLNKADLSGIAYIGADIVGELVESNQRHFGGEDRWFLQLDLTRDDLPAAEVILCRDCLVHLSFSNIRKALANIRSSTCRYLLTTTFLEHEVNEDIADGDWRMLNLQLPPFDLPDPVAILREGCTESGGAYSDKALGLWRTADIPEMQR